jgi:glycosyltransferase involved in cell wall biosynthesis
MSPKVTAIVLSYNHELFIFQALEAVFLQDYNDFEIIIRDDASTDLTPDIIQNFINTHKPLSEKITVEFIKGSKNLGLISSYNDALKKSKGEIIVVFAGDDISDTSRISKSVDLLTKYKVDLIAVNAKVINDQGKVLSESLYNRKGIDRFAGIGEKEGNLRLVNSDNFPSRFISIGGYGYTYHRSILNNYKGFIPEGVYFEDEFLSFLAMWNKGILFTYEPLVKYRRHENNISDKFIKTKNKLSPLLFYKQKECGLYETKINYLKKLDKYNSYLSNKQHILKLEKMLVINKIHVNYLLKAGSTKNISLFMRLLINKNVKVRTKIKYLIYSIFPFLIKKDLEKEIQSRQDYITFN